MLNLKELSTLSDKKLNELLLTYDMWNYNETTKQVYKQYKDHTLIFNMNEFAPFSNPRQADLILQSSGLDFSGIQQNSYSQWGLMVFEDKSKKYLILESPSKMKSSLLLLIAVKSGFLQP